MIRLQSLNSRRPYSVRGAEGSHPDYVTEMDIEDFLFMCLWTQVHSLRVVKLNAFPITPQAHGGS